MPQYHVTQRSDHTHPLTNRKHHIIRTHEPDVSLESTNTFTNKMFACAAKILGIQPTALSEEVLTQLALPLRHGGCGLTNWSFLRTVAYDCSAAGNRQQNIRTEALYAIVLQELKKENKNFYDHLEHWKPRMAPTGSTRCPRTPLPNQRNSPSPSCCDFATNPRTPSLALLAASAAFPLVMLLSPTLVTLLSTC